MRLINRQADREVSMEELNQVLTQASNFVWSYIIVGLCLAGGIYTTLRLLFVQFRAVPHALALLRGKYEDTDSQDGITTFQALATALSGTTGIGTMAGVAIAIKLGGPGAIFWMWTMALLGMALKFVEATLGSMYRGDIGGRHEMGGGPMYYIVKGLGERWRPLAVFYAGCAAIACIGAWNMFQANQAAANLESAFNIPTWITGAVLSIFAALVLAGGIARIGKVAARLVPAMCIIYVTTVLGLCLWHIQQIPAVLIVIWEHAFDFQSAGGGVLGSAVLVGIRRAIFSNEAATGSAAIAHAAAHTSHPVRQGIAASLGPFIDTLMICAATAFVILLSGYYGNESYQNGSGTVLQLSEVELPENTSWHIGFSDMPDDNHPLQHFTSGGSALVYRPLDGQSQPSILELDLAPLLRAQHDSKDTGNAIRFSTVGSVPSTQAELIGPDGAVLANTLVEASPTWGSWIIVPEPQTWSRMITEPDSGKWQLRLSPSANREIWIDRVELVEDTNGIVLSSAAFAKFFGAFGNIFIPVAALFFAYTTILAGAYYGEVACHFLRESWVKPYLVLYIISAFLGCVLDLDLVINFSDLALGLMTIPNLIAMMVLTPLVARETRSYFAALKAGEFNGS